VEAKYEEPNLNFYCSTLSDETRYDEFLAQGERKKVVCSVLLRALKSLEPAESVFLSRSFGFLHGKERNSNNIIFSGAR
jgi:hypothetical protein